MRYKKLKKKKKRNNWALLLFFLFSYLLLRDCNAQNQGNITSQQDTAEAYTWDFGQVRQKQILRHQFIFKNESANTLNITGVSTSCGCTVSEVEKKILPAEEETAIEVTFNSKEYAGPVQQYIYIRTDSLDKPIIRYIIKASVVK